MKALSKFYQSFEALLWSFFADQEKAKRVSLVLGALLLLSLISGTFFSPNLKNLQGEILGGDFFAFYEAGQFVLHGEAITAWDATSFEAALVAREPSSEFYGLTWQYPPAAYFLVTPFALMPYKLAYWVWMLAGLACFAICFRTAFKQPVHWLLLIGSPIVMVSLIQGQNSFFFGGLLILAAALPDKRPVLAGIAAGLLTIKPQLGLLIPIAFIFGGHWRAFISAGITAIAVAIVSTLVFGVESWPAFFDSLSRVNNDMASGGFLYPATRSISPYGALSAFGVPHQIAMIAHFLAVMLLAVVTAKVWRSSLATPLKAALLIPATILCSPYAYYYEMVPVLFSVAVYFSLVGTNHASRLERLWLIAAWLLVLYLPPLQKLVPLQFGFVLMVSWVYLLWQRFMSANAGLPVSEDFQTASPTAALSDKPA